MQTFTYRYYLKFFVCYILSTWVFILGHYTYIYVFKPGKDIREGNDFVWDSELILANAYECLLQSRKCTKRLKTSYYLIFIITF